MSVFKSRDSQSEEKAEQPERDLEPIVDEASDGQAEPSDASAAELEQEAELNADINEAAGKEVEGEAGEVASCDDDSDPHPVEDDSPDDRDAEDGKPGDDSDEPDSDDEAAESDGDAGSDDVSEGDGVSERDDDESEAKPEPDVAEGLEDSDEQEGPKDPEVPSESAEDDEADDRESHDEKSEAPIVEPIEPAKPAKSSRPAHAAPAGQHGYVAAGFGEIPKKKRHRALKAFGITIGVLAVVALAAYVAGAVVFMGRLLPNTVISGEDVSFKTDEEVSALLDGIVADYHVDVIGGGFSYQATGDDIGLAIDSKGIVNAMHAELDSWRWPLLIFQGTHDETDEIVVSFKESAYKANVTAAVEKFNETAKVPVNATITYDKKNEEFVVKPEEAGTKLDVDAVLEALADGVAALERKVSIGDEQLVQPTVLSTDEQLIEAAELATGMVSANLTLVMADKDVATVNGDSLSAFISVNENYEVVFKEDEMNAWVDSLVEGFNTVGTERTYTRADGKAIAVSGGVYGWEIDSDALREAVIEGIKSGATTSIEVPCVETAQDFNGANQRDWGERYIDVDIEEQHVRFYGDDGKIIWEADCISGSPDGKHDTVKGVWTVNAKESPSKLIGYENGKKIYETSVKYWMPFEGNGIGFHDATWQPSFGGTMYSDGYGSHGCVNLSYDDAETLYGIVEEGDVVVVHG